MHGAKPQSLSFPTFKNVEISKLKKKKKRNICFFFTENMKGCASLPTADCVSLEPSFWQPLPCFLATFPEVSMHL